MDNFFEIKNRDFVKLSPKFLDKNYVSHITRILKQKYEGVCSKFGFVKNNSIHVLSVKEGVVERSTFHGYVIFEVEFSAMICNPGIKSIVKCTVKNINSFGLLCVSGIQDADGFKAILNIIVPKHHTNGQSTLTDNSALLDKIAINDEIFVEILGKKYILNNKNINVFGKVVDKELKKEAKTNVDKLNPDNTNGMNDEDDEGDDNDVDNLDSDNNSDIDEEQLNEKDDNDSVDESDLVIDDDDMNGGDFSDVGSVDGDDEGFE